MLRRGAELIGSVAASRVLVLHSDPGRMHVSGGEIDDVLTLLRTWSGLYYLVVG